MKIGVIMFGLMGDVLMRTALLRAIRQVEPAAKIYCYADPVGAEVLELSYDPERVVNILQYRGGKGFLSLIEKVLLIWRVRREKFDVLFDFYNGSFSRKILVLSRCREYFWIDNGKIYLNSRALSGFTPQVLLSNPQHLNELYFSMVSSWRELESPQNPLPWITLSVAKASLEPFNSDKYFLSMATGDPRKNLPIPLLTELADFIYSRFGWAPIIASNPGSEYLQDHLCDSLSKSCIPHQRLQMCGLESILRVMTTTRFSLLPDTGLFHLALASGRPVFGIFTYTNPNLVDPHLPWVRFAFKESRPIKLDQHGQSLGDPFIGAKIVIDELEGFCFRLNRGFLVG